MKINPLNFYQRELDILPPHFVNTVLRINDQQIENVRKWVYEHCSGRYSITKDIVYRDGNSKPVIVLGFENPGDLVLFSLSGMAQNIQN